MSALLILAGVTVCLILFMRWYEPRMIYFPTRELESTPAQLGLVYDDVELTTSDAQRIHGWFLPAAAAPATVTLLFLHGNAGNISHRFAKLAIFRQLRADVLIIDYRGYGRSGGRPSETGTHRDALAAYAWLVGARGIDPRRIVAYGESLGAAVAVDLAARRPVGGLVLESVFSSAVDVAQEMFPFLPARLLMHNRYASVEKIGRVQAPVLILHSRDDEFFGWHHPQRLAAAARSPTTLIELRGGHNDAFAVSAGPYASALSDFLGRIAVSASK